MPQLTVKHKKGFTKKYRILDFGTVVMDGHMRNDRYEFKYYTTEERIGADPYHGVITAGYTANVPVRRLVTNEQTTDSTDEYDSEVILTTREGPNGPEFRTEIRHMISSIAKSTHGSILKDFSADIDTIWSNTLSLLENSLTDSSLDYLDCDPLLLFGIASQVTQRAVDRCHNEKEPVLRCTVSGTLGFDDTGKLLAESEPSKRIHIDDWFAYLRADKVIDANFSWVIESFTVIALPVHWKRVIGVGGIICFVNTETNETTWKHPHYDYFSQLLAHCRSISQEEHIILRIQRMMWSYETESMDSMEISQTIVSPSYVSQLAKIYGLNISEEPHMVHIIKLFLKAFSLQYRTDSELEIREIKYSLEILEGERRRRLDMSCQSRESPVIRHDQEQHTAVSSDYASSSVVDLQYSDDSLGKNLSSFDQSLSLKGVPNITSGYQFSRVHTDNSHSCEHCKTNDISKICYCLACKDYLCDGCFLKLHTRGKRMNHQRNLLIVCSLCDTRVASLQSSRDWKCYCINCYERQESSLSVSSELQMKPVIIPYEISVSSDKTRRGKLDEKLHSRSQITGSLKVRLMGNTVNQILKENTPSPIHKPRQNELSRESTPLGSGVDRQSENIRQASECSEDLTTTTNYLCGESKQGECISTENKSAYLSLANFFPKTDSHRSEGPSEIFKQKSDRKSNLPISLTDNDIHSEGTPKVPTLSELHMTPVWHPFHDKRGVKYYYNFKTEESVLRPHNTIMYHGIRSMKRSSSVGHFTQELPGKAGGDGIQWSYTDPISSNINTHLKLNTKEMVFPRRDCLNKDQLSILGLI